MRHTTRNFPNREGSKPGNGQIASVALMDARSIAATAAYGVVLTSAEQFADNYQVPAYHFDGTVYENRVYQGFGKGCKEKELIYGPNIKDWPAMSQLADKILLKVCSRIMDPVTTTDEYFVKYDVPTTFTVCGKTVIVESEQLAAALMNLPEKRREVLFLRYYLGYSDEEIGKMCGISRSAVCRRRKIALRLLRKEMEALENEE